MKEITAMTAIDNIEKCSCAALLLCACFNCARNLFTGFYFVFTYYFYYYFFNASRRKRLAYC